MSLSTVQGRNKGERDRNRARKIDGEGVEGQRGEGDIVEDN